MNDNLARVKAITAKLSTVDPSTIHVSEANEHVTVYAAARHDGELVYCVMPTLKPHTPQRVRRAMQARIEATLTGTCPSCHGITGASSSTRMTTQHEPDCLAAHTELLSKYADPTGQAAIIYGLSGDRGAK